MTSFIITKDFNVLVDDEDFPVLLRFNWYLNSDGYVSANVDKLCLRAHRLVMGMAPFKKAVVDHIDGNKLDCRKANLRWATNGHNVQKTRKVKPGKTSKYRGVSLTHKETRSYWVAQIGGLGNHKSKHCNTEEEAAHLYDAWAKEMFGEHCFLNFPGEV